MKKKLLASLLTVAMLLTLLPVSALAAGAEKSAPAVQIVPNTETWYDEASRAFMTRDTYWRDVVSEQPAGYTVDAENKTVTIASAAALAWWAKQVNAGTSFAGYTVSITDDLDMSAHYWTPMCTGTVTVSDGKYSVAANDVLDGTVIDGNGHSITGLATSTGLRGPNEGSSPGDGQNCYYYAGFIGYNACNLTIEDLSFSKAQIAIFDPFDQVVHQNGSSSVAVVVGAQTGGSLTLRNVDVDAAKTLAMQKTAAFIGNLTGSATLAVENCTITNSTFSAYFMVAPIVSYANRKNVSVDGIQLANNTVQVVEQSSQDYRYDADLDAEYWIHEYDCDKDEVSEIGHDLNACATALFWSERKVIVEDSETWLMGAPLQLVAEVNGYQYDSLAGAIAAAQPGDPVTLLKNLTVSEPIVIDKAITLDLNTKTLENTFTASSDASGTGRFSLVTKADVTIQNGTYASTGSATDVDTRGICQSQGDLTLTSLVTTCNGINVCNYATSGTLTISDCQISGDYAVGSFADLSTVKITDSKLTGTTCGLYHNGSYYGLDMTVTRTDIIGGPENSEDGSGVYLSGSTSTTQSNGGKNQQAIFTDCKISGATGIEVKFTDLTLNNCSVVTTSESTPTFEQYNNGSTTTGFSVVASDNTMSPTSPAPSGTITINGSYYDGLVGLKSLIDPSEYPNFKEATYVITGGTFTDKPDDSYLGTGLTFTAKDETNGPWTVGPAQGMSADATANGDTATAEVGGIFNGKESEDASSNVGSENSTIAINVTTSDPTVTTTQVTIQGASLTSVQEAEAIQNVEIATDVGKVTLTKAAWNEITENAAQAVSGEDPAPVTLTISKAEFEDFTGTDGIIPGVTITATANGQDVFSDKTTKNPITVSVPVPSSVDTDTVQVYYLGATGPELIAFKVESGNLVWDVTHFSDYAFASGYEAAVTSGTDTVFYYSLQSAITAAHVGGSYVTLLKDIDLTSDTKASLITVPSGHDITINCTGEQFTITGSYTYASADDGKTIGLFTVGSGSTVTLDNVGLELTGNNKGTTADGGANIYMGTGILLNPNSDLKIINGSDVQLNTLSRGLVSGTTGSQVLVDNSSLTVNGTSGNGSNGGDWTIQNSSEVQFLNNGNHGLSVETLAVSASNVSVDNAGYTGIYASQIALYASEVTVTNSAKSASLPASYQDKGAVQLKQSGTPSLSLTNGSTLTLSGNGNAEGGKQLISLGSATLAKSPDSVIYGELDGGSSGYVVTVMDGSALIEQAVVTDGTYTLPAAPVKDGYTFKGWLRDNGELCSARQKVSISEHTTFTAKWEANPTTPGDDDTPSQPSGGDSSNDYFIDTGYSKYGKVTAYPGWAEAGDTVKLTVKPNSGYELSELSVTSSGKSVKLTAVGENQFTFTMPSGTVSVEATFTASNTPAPVIPSTGFVDVSASAWYYNAVNYVVDEGIMSGTGANTFEPNTTLTRAMVAQMLYAMSGKPNQGSNTFGDVDSSAWYADAVAWVSYKGVMTGYGEGRFAPNTPVTREQMALILYNYAKLQGYDTDASSSLSSFADGASVSSWAQQAMSWAVAQGLFSGRDGNMLTPAGTATRAEIAQIFMQFCKNVAE